MKPSDPKVKPAVIPRNLQIGSQVEVAKRLRHRLQATHGRLVGSEGNFWYFNGKCWQAHQGVCIKKMVQDFDGGTYDKGETLRVSNTFISGTLKCLADQVEHHFFIKHDIGICRTSGFITLDSKFIEHDPEQRQRQESTTSLR